MSKKNCCPNTYFNREIGGYIGLLIEADGLLTALETAYADGFKSALEKSRELDGVIADIMIKRRTVSEILLADSTFS